MKAVMYGGGNIGRGFIGFLFSRAGYEVTFVDVIAPVVEALHRERSYPVRIVSTESHEDIEISGVDAVDGNDTAAVAALIAETDIMATAVGVGSLQHIIPNLVTGIRARFAKTERPLDIIICENLLDADKVLAKMITECLTGEECSLFYQRVGLVEASIGRMVPIQTPEMRDGNPLRVCVEHYGFLPVDRNAFKGPVPDIPRLLPVSPFSFYIKRKLFLHNMGHGVCAYLGLYMGREFIYQAIDDPDILLIVKNAMMESVEALCLKYNENISPLLHHVDDLLDRFTNRALGDTCARVGQDPQRKLAQTDRFIGAARFCLNHGVIPVYITIGAAGALYHLLHEQGADQSHENALDTLQSLSKYGRKQRIDHADFGNI
jgi:mannitol-1-phosphate 5-dehydrogenase